MWTPHKLLNYRIPESPSIGKLGHYRELTKMRLIVVDSKSTATGREEPVLKHSISASRTRLNAGHSWVLSWQLLGLMCGSQRLFSLGLCLGYCNPSPGFYSLFLCAAPTVPPPPTHCHCSKKSPPFSPTPPLPSLRQILHCG